MASVEKNINLQPHSDIQDNTFYGKCFLEKNKALNADESGKADADY